MISTPARNTGNCPPLSGRSLSNPSTHQPWRSPTGVSVCRSIRNRVHVYYPWMSGTNILRVRPILRNFHVCMYVLHLRTYPNDVNWFRTTIRGEIHSLPSFFRGLRDFLCNGLGQSPHRSPGHHGHVHSTVLDKKNRAVDNAQEMGKRIEDLAAWVNLLVSPRFVRADKPCDANGVQAMQFWTGRNSAQLVLWAPKLKTSGAPGKYAVQNH